MAIYERAKSFERALFDGDIKGPSWPVVDTETGEPALPGSQDYRHTDLGRRVLSLSGQNLSETVTDYQMPSELPPR